MGQHRPLGRTGRPAGILDEGDILGVDGRHLASAVIGDQRRKSSDPATDRPLRDLAPLQQPVEEGFGRSEEHTSELQSLMRISYAVFCLRKKKYSSSYMRFTNTGN